MKTILVPTDFSSTAMKALDYAVGLSQNYWTNIILVHVHEFLAESSGDRDSYLVTEHNEIAKKQIVRQLRDLEKEVWEKTCLRIRTVVYDGDVEAGILQAAEDFAADFMIMGTRGARRPSSKIFGSNTSSILRKSRIPVFVIPPGYEWTGPKHILIAVNDEQTRLEQLSLLFDLVGIYRPQISAVLFSDEEEGDAEILTDANTIRLVQHKFRFQFPELKIEAKQVAGHGFPEWVQQYIQTKQTDILVVFSHHRRWIDFFLHRSLTQNLVRNPDLPILCFPV